jgi:hypothetical protein
VAAPHWRGSWWKDAGLLGLGNIGSAVAIKALSETGFSKSDLRGGLSGIREQSKRTMVRFQKIFDEQKAYFPGNVTRPTRDD